MITSVFLVMQYVFNVIEDVYEYIINVFGISEYAFAKLLIMSSESERMVSLCLF